MTVKFELICLFNPAEIAGTCTVGICIVPADSKNFAESDVVMDVENVDGDSMVKYGYPCGVQDG